MSAPPNVEAARELAEVPEAKEPRVVLRLEDTLAAPGRLWVRGRLAGMSERASPAAGEKRWWRRRKGKPEPAALPGTIELETRVGGSVLHANACLKPSGRFEAPLVAALPVARRGWRIARHRVSWLAAAASAKPGGFGSNQPFTAEACSLVLTPPAEAVGVVVVILPLEYTSRTDGIQHFAQSEFAARLASLLKGLGKGAGGFHPLYYLAGIAGEGDNHQAEWALAAASLGWPAGQFIFIPADRETVAAELLHSLDRLRWLFAGSLELLVLNLEPELAELLTAQLGPAEDRAVIRRLVNPEDDPWKVCNRLLGKAARVEVQGLRRIRGSLLPRYPTVFCHGMLAFTTLKMHLPDDLNCFAPLRDFLQQRGFRVLFPQVPPTSGVAERAAALRQQILRWTDEPVNLIAHSMGGLDARFMITHLGMADRVRSLTTVSTPHRGTYLADWFLTNFRKRVPLLLAMEAFGINVDGFRDCQLAVCQEFNSKTPDRPEVRYFSFGGEVPQARVTPFLRRAWNLLTPREGPNDGMVSVASARWGEYLGTVHADHFAQTPDALFLRAGEDFDSLGFYCRLVEDLARRGF